MENEILGRVKASSYQTYANLIDKHISPVLDRMKLCLITPSVVLEFVTCLQRFGMANSTARSAYRLFVSAMKAAHDEGLIKRNPCRKIRIQHSEAQEQRVLTPKEQLMLKNELIAAKSLPALLSLYTGMRLGEVCALKKSDINPENSTAHSARLENLACRRFPEVHSFLARHSFADISHE